MRTEQELELAAAQIRLHFGDRIQEWHVSQYKGHGGHLRVTISDVTFADLQIISGICGGTKDINVHHEPASGSEFTPSGDFMEVVIWGSAK